MKRFLSIMLTVMLVLSSVVAFAEAGPVTNVSNETKTVTLDKEYSGSILVSADVLVKDGTTAEMKTFNAAGEETGSAIIDTSIVDASQTAEILLYGGKAVKSVTFITDGNMTVNNIKVDKAYKETLLYDEDFEGYAAGDDMITKGYEFGDYTSADTTNYSTFTVAENVAGEGMVGNLYNKGNSNTANRFDNSGNEDTEAGKVASGTSNNEYFSTSASLDGSNHIRAEFKMYVAANALHPNATDYASATVDQIVDNLRVGFVPSTLKHCYTSNALNVQLRAKYGVMQNRVVKTDGSTDGTVKSIGHYNPAKEWVNVVIEAERLTKTINGRDYACIDYTMTVGGVSFEATIEDAGGMWDRLVLGVDFGYGGRVYVDDIKIYGLEEISENVMITRYEEDFEDYTAGADMTDYYDAGVYNSTATEGYTTFTVAKNIGGKTGYVGNLYNPSYTTTKAIRVNDAGETDATAFQTGGADQPAALKDFYSVPVDINNSDKIKLEFKYYLPNNGLRTDNANETYDMLRFGIVGDTMRHCMASEVINANTRWQYIWYQMRTKNDAGGYAGTNPLLRHYAAQKTWLPVVLEAERNIVDDVNVIDYTIKINGYTATGKIEKASANWGRLVFGVDNEFGGRIYIDDIKVTSPLVDASDLDDIEIYTESLYSVESPFVIEKAGSSDKVVAGAVDKVTLTNNIVSSEKVQCLVGVYENKVLKDACITEVDLATIDAGTTEEITLSRALTIPETTTGYSVYVMIFDTLENLSPLVDKFVVE